MKETAVLYSSRSGARLRPARSGRRWVIERTFAWLERYHRLARDWEAASWSVCALIYIAISNLIARRHARLWAT
jgi:hypothetical protein